MTHVPYDLIFDLLETIVYVDLRIQRATRLIYPTSAVVYTLFYWHTVDVAGRLKEHHAVRANSVGK